MFIKTFNQSYLRKKIKKDLKIIQKTLKTFKQAIPNLLIIDLELPNLDPISKSKSINLKI